MGEKIKIKNSSTDHVYEGGILTGLGIAQEVLRGASNSLPGIGLARALIDAEFHKHRAPYLLSNLKAVSKEGYSIETIKSVYGINETEIEIELYDLADLAEKGE